MTAEHVSLKVNRPESNRKLNSNLTTQKLLLLDSQRRDLAVVALYKYPKGGFYSFYWHTDKKPAELVSLIEDCVSYYERYYRWGTKDRKWGPTPFKENPKKKNALYQSMDVDFKKGKEIDSKELKLPPRPFNLEKIVEKIGTPRIIFLRLNTSIGDFCITPGAKGFDYFGVLSSAYQTEGFSQLLLNSSFKKVDKQIVDSLLSKAVELIRSRVPRK